ncbi:MAG: fumarylacetoacetate hydrolase family protein [Chloroflexi bacterium]|nr:fumarylacetoacetate hydrolase family protein [Chloroflexota bacterium]
MGVDSGSGPVPLSLRSIKLLLASGDKGLDDVHRAFEFAVDSGDETWRFPVAGVRLHAPITTPRKVLALAGNYAAHIREGGREAPEKERSAPQVFMKPPTTLIGPDEPIRLPGDLCAAVDYEGELAVVIGRRCFAVTPDEASHCIAGYVNFNDVSCRRLSIEVEREPNARTAFFDWLNGKWFDTFGPIGPALVTIDEVPNPQALQLQTRVNGEVRQHASTAEMIFGVDEIISWISRMMTLEPGDVIATGTPSGVGSSTGRFLQPGDVVEVEISGLGVLRNPVDGPTPERDT